MVAVPTQKYCHYCGIRLVVSSNHAEVFNNMATRDHILPVARGGKLLRRGVLNIRVCCYLCNQRRANCGHCIAAMACIQTVAQNCRVPFETVYKKWNMQLHNDLLHLQTKHKAQPNPHFRSLMAIMQQKLRELK